MTLFLSPLCGFRLVAQRTLAAGVIVVLTIMAFADARADDPEVSGGPGSVELAPFGGQWNRIPDEEEDASRHLSIDAAIDDLSWILRSMAGRMLKKSTAPPVEMGFDWDGERLHQLVHGAHGELRRPVQLNGDSQRHTNDRGDDFSSKWVWTEGGLQVHWVQDQAFGSNLYRVDPLDQMLRVEHRIQITAISGIEPIVFRSRFGRTDLPTVTAARDPETESSPDSSELR